MAKVFFSLFLVTIALAQFDSATLTGIVTDPQDLSFPTRPSVR
jgi:hypothetical protein